MKILGFPITALVFLLTCPAFCQLQTSPAAIDFGYRGHNENPTATLVLSNTGSVPITIRELKPSCSCIKIEPQKLAAPIPAGGSVELKVSMGSGRAIGSLEKHLEITAAEAGVPLLTVPLRMRVLDGLAVEPTELKFDGAIGGQSITQSVNIKWSPRVKAPKPFTLTDAVVTGPPVAVPPPAAAAGGKPVVQRPLAQDTSAYFETKVTDIPGGKRIEVTLKPTHPEGRIWGNLEAKIDGKLVVVPVVGEMFRSIKIVPTYFNFSRVASDDPASYVKESVLTSIDGHPFKVLSMTPKVTRGGSEVRLELTETGAPAAGAGLTHTLRARISGSKTDGDGGFSGTVLVKTDHSEKQEITLNFFGFFAEPRKQTKP